MMLMASTTTAGPSADRADMLSRRIRLLVATTISYNVAEAGVAIAAGAVASSAALLGFGLDSVIEVSSAVAVAWQFAARDHHQREARERAALRVIAVSFFALAAFVGSDAIRALAGASQARPSAAGIVLAAVSLVIMPVLSTLQRRAGRQLGSASAVADSRQTMLCTYLSGVLLLGLAANAALGWWWADPIAALVIALYAIREGREAWRGRSCCPLPQAAATGSERDEYGCEHGCTCQLPEPDRPG
jgi:divalent metal cation (Fe/Co/Zn/Cd) transporter